MTDSLYVDEQGEPMHVDSVVLFLDLLGTQGPRSRAEARDHLRTTRDALSTATRWADAQPRQGSGTSAATWFSDNLCLSYAVREMLGATGSLGWLVTDTTYLQLALLRHGVFARGAITKGGFYVDSDFIHGPALDRAVLLEKSRARFPRVVLDETSIATARHGLVHEEGGSHGSPWREQLVVDSEGEVFVDYLSALTEEPDDDRGIRDYLTLHKAHIEANLRVYDGIPSVHDKYRWLASYHNYFVEQQRG
jgi:hypothetical protein